ncbi:TadE/TadG family type IV pilus assembly protein [Rhizobium sp. SGZ-381]|uniref:TadE/TadG family type IV pilus assembly protein n=1 Tax=Rhizobium sp. SGZ-381 TaxID=3342800 RepID=UPI003672D069
MEGRQRRGVLLALNRLINCRRGVGSVEFAILAPILISLYICCFELTMGLSTAKRVTRSAATVADLVTQQTSVNTTFLSTMLDVTQAIFVPYDASAVSLKITGITIDQTKTPKVLWSWQQDGGLPYAAGTVINDVPDDMKTANSFLVRAELSVPHTLLLFLPGLLSTDTRSITISRTFYDRQRVGDSITCSDC